MAHSLHTDTTPLVRFPAGEIDWEAQPEQLTTRQVADLLGKSPGNVRARASKGDFGVTTPGPDGLPRYDRERVRPIYDRMIARQAQSRNPQFAAAALSEASNPALAPAMAALLAAIQAQQEQHTALCKAWMEEAQEMRALLRDREETTRETLSHLDMLHDQNCRQSQETLARERAHWTAEIAARDAEIERLNSDISGKKNDVAGWRK